MNIAFGLVIMNLTALIFNIVLNKKGGASRVVIRASARRDQSDGMEEMKLLDACKI